MMTRIVLIIIFFTNTLLAQVVSPSSPYMGKVVSKLVNYFQEPKYSEKALCKEVDLTLKSRYLSSCPNDQDNTGTCYAQAASGLLNCELEQSFGLNFDQYISASWIAYSSFQDSKLEGDDISKDLDTFGVKNAINSLKNYCTIEDKDLKDQIGIIEESFKLMLYRSEIKLDGVITNRRKYLLELGKAFADIKKNGALKLNYLEGANIDRYLKKIFPNVNLQKKFNQIDYYQYLDIVINFARKEQAIAKDSFTNVKETANDIKNFLDLDSIDNFEKILFPEPKISKNNQIINPHFDYEALFKHLCKNTNKKIQIVGQFIYINNKEIGRVQETNINRFNQKSVINAFKDIHQVLNSNNPKPVAINICGEILQEKPRASYKDYAINSKEEKKKCSNHGVLVIGSRYRNNKCEFRIRNSWGKNCKLLYAGYPCDNGDIWIPVSELMKVSNQINYFKNHN